ncbi:MAG: 4Fe-4S binding protein [Bacteroidales bacterium]|nr:4Fe-4S binding protein [Bacteroidales bacterium]
MGFKILKRIRVGVSLLFFLLIFFLFIDFTNSFSAFLVNSILYLQFIPSLIKFLDHAALAVAGFVFILLLTLLFGRIYCSTFCPLGTLQDIIIFLSKKFKKRKVFKYAEPKNLLRFSILIIVVVTFLGGSILLINLLDPYSVFGKMISNLVRPVYYTANNLGVAVFERFEIYVLFPVKLKSYSWLTFGFSISMLGLIGWLAIYKGRLYCNTVCPLGTLLGITSRFSLFKIRLDESACTSCGICGSVCKSGCINTREKSVDFSRCVGCFNCLTVCGSGGVVFQPRVLNSTKPALNETPQINDRRSFIKNSALISAGVLQISKQSFTQGLNNGKVPVKKEFPVTPPGSISIAQFTGKCTACHLCISACPTHVLQPSLLHYGLAGIMQPTMDYKASFCNFECTLCSEICPTGAILPIEPEKKKLTQLGKAHFIKENCIVYTDEKDCGACSEHCPTKAVNMVFYKGTLKIPEVNAEICVGCGACEYACPTTPKSIYVDGNPVHLIAEKPKTEEVIIEVDTEEDFPF